MVSPTLVVAPETVRPVFSEAAPSDGLLEAAVDTALGDRWQTLVLGLIEQGAVQALVRELAWSSALLSIDEQTAPPTWRLAVERESMRQPAIREKLQAAIGSCGLETLQLELVAAVPQDSPAKRDTAAQVQRQAQAVATIQEDPVVRELLARYKGARIVPGSIKPV